MQIALIDYGAGNLTSVRKGFSAVGGEPRTPVTPRELNDCSGIVLPGVGHFAATSSIAEAWRQAIAGRVEAGVPFLGICLGMQWLFDGSEEAPEVPGLGLVRGRCARLQAERPLKVPHVGWNELSVLRPSSIADGIEDRTQVYFTHSFAAPVTPECSASTTHGQAFAAVLEHNNVAGVQFHPEKSGAAGLRVLCNFLAMTRR